jgi:hypothetical protein
MNRRQLFKYAGAAVASKALAPLLPLAAEPVKTYSFSDVVWTVVPLEIEWVSTTPYLWPGFIEGLNAIVGMRYVISEIGLMAYRVKIERKHFERVAELTYWTRPIGILVEFEDEHGKISQTPEIVTRIINEKT